VLIALLFATFMIVRLVPGDPARRILGSEASPEDVQALRTEMGLDMPILNQFASYSSHVFRIDLGHSFITNQPVAQIIAERLPRTAELALAALLLVLILSIPMGIAAGVATRERRRPRLELAFGALTSVGGALPEYLAATFLAFFFAVFLRLLPVAGADNPLSVVLPALAISIRPIVVLARIVRVETLNVLAQDFIRTARSKRLPAVLLYGRHTLRNVITSALTIGGLVFTGLLGGTVVVENVFAWPGLGTVLVQAVLARDYPVIQGVTLFLGIAVVVVNTTIDLLLGVLDPRTAVRAQ
jgi:peptide/nickel transport system permease protein